MPRRLGDDPLARARDERAKAAQASSTTTVDQESASQLEFRTSSRASSNDVFFQRKAERTALVEAPSAPEAPEISEISEISEIPEIREVQAAPIPAFTEAPVIEFDASSNAVATTSVEQLPPASTIEEIVEKFSAPVAPAEAVPENGPASPAVESSALSPVSGAEIQKSGGFFKRLFGKFK